MVVDGMVSVATPVVVREGVPETLSFRAPQCIPLQSWSIAVQRGKNGLTARHLHCTAGLGIPLASNDTDTFLTLLLPNLLLVVGTLRSGVPDENGR